MNKEELEKQISLLQERVEANKVMNQGYESDLLKAKQDLEDLNKPVISSEVMNTINDAINEALENYNFDNTDQYEIDFSLDYEGRVQAETINLTDTYGLMEAIVSKVEKQFNISLPVKDDNSQVNTQTVAEKII